MKSDTDPRHTSRKLALSSIFSWLFTETDTDKCVSTSTEILESEGIEYDDELTKIIVEGVKKHSIEIDKIIEECAPEWPIDKIAKIDLVILRIAIFEILFGKKTPAKVAIDEAVEIAKEFGNDTSHKFINGVLGAVVEKYLPKEMENILKEEKEK
ncbi:transcription antitermination factor NusB [candidate division WWE3 bacterium]|uniref:Transcription antitermination protein NusB n=1 Tax=candidate division WWE3 bacterium TaxID=2053526 RepID=A0A7X9HSR2_UNCKA|nr:transcription antitermination factor NusB [candidate division WWE3 bacterium]